MFKDENELIETTKATAELLEKEIDNEDTKIPNAQSIQLTGEETLPELRGIILGKFASYAESKELKKLGEDWANIGAEASRIADSFNSRGRDIESDDRYTEDAKRTIFNNERKATQEEIRELIKKQQESKRKEVELQNKIATRAWSEISASKVSDLTPSDYSYIELMMKQGASKKEIAKQLNYNPRALDILNAGSQVGEKIIHPLESLLRVNSVVFGSNDNWHDPARPWVNSIQDSLRHYKNKPLTASSGSIDKSII